MPTRNIDALILIRAVKGQEDFSASHKLIWLFSGTWVDSVVEVLFLGTALVTVILVFAIAHQMSAGIFRRFFFFVKLAVIVILVGRVNVDLLQFPLLTRIMNPQTADYAWRVVWSFLLMFGFIALYLDWKRTSLDQPIKPRSVTKVES